MFSWVAKAKKKEILKLLFQNNSFLLAHVQVYPQDSDAKVWFESVKKINAEFLNANEIDDKALRTLLEVNRNLRIFFDKNDPEMKLYANGLTKVKPKSFDQKFQPLLGWKEYYESYGL